jgi:hypothetical protein
MPKENHCLSCGTKLINRRSHTKTCSSKCRVQHWRSKQDRLVPLKLAFNVAHFEAINLEAAQLGVTVKSLIMSRSLATPPSCN